MAKFIFTSLKFYERINSMINKINFTPSFASTKIKLQKDEEPLHVVDRKFLSHVNKYFTLADMNFDKSITSQKLADKIDYDQYIVHYKNGALTIVGKDGGEGGADTFIGKILTKLYPDRAIFTDDVKPLEYKENAVDLDIKI